jgi:hypothetical protein
MVVTSVRLDRTAINANVFNIIFTDACPSYLAVSFHGLRTMFGSVAPKSHLVKIMQTARRILSHTYFKIFLAFRRGLWHYFGRQVKCFEVCGIPQGKNGPRG